MAENRVICPAPFAAEPFLPSPLLAGTHAQIVGARLLRPAEGVPLSRHRIDTPDGDFIDLDFTPSASDAAKPLVIVLHGLEGSSRSKYAIVTYRLLERFGIGAVGMNFRSCSGELNRAPRMYHSGETGDLRFVATLLANRFPNRPMAAIGFSLGGNVLLKYLGEKLDIPPGLAAAAAVSVPYDLSAGADYLERGFARIYRWRLMRSLRRKVIAKHDVLGSVVDYEAVRRSVTFREFDDAATAPVHGFDGAEDYYQRSSSKRFLRSIETPTYLIHADDDPFLPPDCVPQDEVRNNVFIEASFLTRGGHVGFMAGGLLSPVFWAEQTAAGYVAHRLSVLQSGAASAAVTG